MPFKRIADEPIHVHAREPAASYYQLSPFVWRERHDFHILLRAVPYAENPAEKIARVYHGASRDGLEFYLDQTPAIAPGPSSDDGDGCEDPTVIRSEGEMFVYYTGWNQERRRGCLMLASGPDAAHLRKRGVALASNAQTRNPKEAEVAFAGDGVWRLLFEFSTGEASRIGLARSDCVSGPWDVGAAPFECRPEKWDSWHLSPGPVLAFGESRTMFYNGASRDAKWRVGWIRFDATYSSVLERCDAPIIVPAAARGDETDIAFAASALAEGDLVRIYYSVADQYMRRATIHRT